LQVPGDESRRPGFSPARTNPPSIMNRRVIPMVSVLLLLVFGWWRFRPEKEPMASSAATATAGLPPAAVQSGPTPALALGASPVPSLPTEHRIALADPLDAPDGNIESDLHVLNEIFQAWQTNFPHDGNPVGENNEITAALLGNNRLQLALIPRNHRAINAQGELCDRWETPFRFHQLSGTQMEIISAGPDRKFGTADDARLSP
jgi:hypothetical protein